MRETETPLFRKPELKALDDKSITEFTEEIKKTPLQPKQKQAMQKFLATDKNSIALSELINEFIKMQDHYGGLPGLTPQQTTELRELVATRKEFRNSHRKGEFNQKAFKTFFATEKKLVPYNQIMQWWSTTAESLNKLALWEDVNSIVIGRNRNTDTPENLFKDRLHKLTDIKNDWNEHSVFALYSSENLMEFYNNYICSMEKRLVSELTENANYPQEVREYLSYSLHQLREIKKQAINSMFFRLSCTEFYGDVTCDDVLNGTLDKIEFDCNIQLKRSGKRPPLRKGFTPELISQFILSIKEYCASVPEEASLLDHLEKLSVKREPPLWNRDTEKEISVLSLARDPILIFCANKFPETLEEAKTQKNIPKVILNEDTIESGRFILSKLQELIKLAHARVKLVEPKKPGSLNYKIAKKVDEWDKQLADTTQEIAKKATIELQNNVNKIIDGIIKNNKIEFDLIGQVLDQIKNAERFNDEFIQQKYIPEADILLAISVRLRDMVSRQTPIGPIQIENIYKILIMCYPCITSEEQQKLKEQLNKLPDCIKQTKSESGSYLTHYISHYIEASILSEENLLQSVYRHKYISEYYLEQWADCSTTAKDTPENIKLLMQYFKNVLIKLIRQAPNITLDNFDTNQMAGLIKQIDIQVRRKDHAADSFIDKVKDEYEFEILNKINDTFNIKNYLYQNDSLLINIENLHKLIDKTSRFFTNPDYQKSMLNSIESACMELIKGYIISLIEGNIAPDFKYLQQISAIFKKDILMSLSTDVDIKKLLTNYIKTYNGDNSVLAKLLTELSPWNTRVKNDDMIYTYASKRLTFISASNDINLNDFYFFDHYNHLPDVKKLFLSHKKKHEGVSTDIIKNLRTTWDRNKALIIELFGEDDAVNAYRLCRIRELLYNHDTDASSDFGGEKIFSEFISATNPLRLTHDRLVKSSDTVGSNTSLGSYLDYAVTNRPWTLLIEKMTEVCGTDVQMQALHYKFLMRQLDGYKNFNDHWINKRMMEINQASDVGDINIQSDLYIKFLGEKNIQRLCIQIEKILESLEAVNTYTNNHELSLKDYQACEAMMETLKPFTVFYSLFGKNSKLQTTMQHLTELEKKIQLHQTLQQEIKKQTSLLSVANEDLVFHNLILSLLRAITDIENKKYLSDDNINDYIKFCNDEILDKIINTINNPATTFSFDVLTTLLNLIAQLSSDTLKNQLMKAHKDDALTNPLWLSLINHMDENHAVLSIACTINDADQSLKPGLSFANTLQFAKRLTTAKHMLHQIIKTSLLKEAGIKIPNSDTLDFDTLIQPNNASDKQLLSLLSLCLTQLKSLAPSGNTLNRSSTFMVKLARKISDEVLLRAKSDPELLYKFVNQLGIIEEMHVLEFTPQTFSLWTTKTDADKLFDPLKESAQKAVIMMLIQTIEKFVLKNVDKDKLPIYRKICNDPTYTDARRSPEESARNVQNMLETKNDVSALAIASTIKLYNRSNALLHNKEKSKAIFSCIEELSKFSTGNIPLLESSSYKSFIDEVLLISKANPFSKGSIKMQNDSIFRRLFTSSAFKRPTSTMR